MGKQCEQLLKLRALSAQLSSISGHGKQRYLFFSPLFYVMTHIQPQTRVFDPKGHETFVTHTASPQPFTPFRLQHSLALAQLLQDLDTPNRTLQWYGTPPLFLSLIYDCQMMNWHWAPTVLDKIGAGL